MLGTTHSSRTLVVALSVAILGGCSSMQPTPTMPTYPAKVGYGGVTRETDSICRQQAQQAAEQTKQQNANTEVTTDMVFLRRLHEGEAPCGYDWRFPPNRAAFGSALRLRLGSVAWCVNRVEIVF